MVVSSSEAQSIARRRVRHFGADFTRLDEQFPGVYPRMFVQGAGTDLVDADGHRVPDTSTIDLCFSGFPCALFRSTKSSFGRSEYTVKSEIWIAVSVYVLETIIKKLHDLQADLYTILQVLSLSLFEKNRRQT